MLRSWPYLSPPKKRRKENGKTYLAVLFARRLFFSGGPCVSSLLLISFLSNADSVCSFRLRGTFAGTVFSCNTSTFFPRPPKSSPMCLVGSGSAFAVFFSLGPLPAVSAKFAAWSRGSFVGVGLNGAFLLRFFGGGGSSSLRFLDFGRVPAEAHASFDFSSA